MRTTFVACAAIAVLGLCPRFLSSARAATPKGKAAASKAAESKRPNELHADDKSMKKQLQWEDKVMGPDSTRADLARIARAHALNEKAIKDRELQAAREAAAPPPAPAPAQPNGKTSAKRAEVVLPSVNDGARSDDNVASRGISPKLATDEAKAAPAPAKPADDKFIDKLLREETEAGASRRKSHSGSDRDLDKLLATASEKPAGKGGDAVDKLIKKADSGPAMPAPRAQTQPAWISQPDLPSTPAVTAPPPPVAAAKPAARRNDGVVRVVQGAAAADPAEEPTPTSAPTARASSNRGSSSSSRRSETSPKSATTWNDPFAEPAVASRDHASASAPRKAPASRASAAPSDWNDPFADKPTDGKATRRTSAPAPSGSSASPKRGDKGDPSAHPSGWKDPFTKAPTEPVRAAVAMREVSKSESRRWEAAAHHAATSRATTSDAPQGWALLKKRSR